MIVQALNEVQEKHGYIPEAELYVLAQKLRVPVYELHGVATYYPGYRMKPPPKADVRVCGDFPCRLRGSEPLRKLLEEIAAEAPAGTCEVKHVSCLGKCDMAPAISVNDHPMYNMDTNGLANVVKLAIAGEKLPHPHYGHPPKPYRCDPYPDEASQYGAVKALTYALKNPAPASDDDDAVKGLAAMGPVADILAKLKASGLRGMGGAGFPTGTKWEAVKNCVSDRKYIVCNADECEVGTVKDRELMRNCPHLLAEGMILAGLVTGATQGYIYIRHEYHDQIETMNKEIERARGLGLVGENIQGTGLTYNLEVFVSPGGYVQGEESALLEAIEGKRGQPRVKPPFPVFVGLWGKPTVINNVETLSYVPSILVKGPDWFKSQGKNGCFGIKWIGVSGHVNNPGVWEVPMGTTYREAIYDLGKGVTGGRPLKAFAPSGPSGGFLPPSMIDLNMDFKIMSDAGSMLGSGAIVAMSDTVDLLDMALNATRFFRNESCGKCVPCRVGSQKMVDTIASIAAGTGTNKDVDTIHQLAETMNMASICGLGQVVAAPIQSLLKHFPNEIYSRIKS